MADAQAQVAARRKRRPPRSSGRRPRAARRISAASASASTPSMRSIHALLNERARFAQLVGISKSASRQGGRFLPPGARGRGAAQGARAQRGPLRDEEIARLFREIMSACLAQQEPLKVAFLGPGGHVHPGRGAQAFRILGARAAAARDRRGVSRGGGRRRGFRRGAHRELERGHGQPYARHVSRLVAQDLRRGGAAHPSPPDGPHERARATSSACAPTRRRSRSAAAGWTSICPSAERIAESSNAEGARRARDERGTAAIASRAAAEIYGLNAARRTRSRIGPTTPPGSW